MWTKLSAWYKRQLAAWREHQQSEFRQEELAYAYMLEEHERLIREAQTADEKEKADFAECVARRVVELLKEEGWITKNNQQNKPQNSLWTQESQRS